MGIAADVYSMLIQKGVPQRVATGAIASLMGESGNKLNPNSLNPHDGRDGSDSIGFYQANGSRAALIKQKASELGTTWNDPRAQIAAMSHELDTTHAHVLRGLKAGQTEQDGVSTWTKRFEVPANASLRAQERMGNIEDARAAIGDAAPAGPVGAPPTGSPLPATAPVGLLGGGGNMFAGGDGAAPVAAGGAPGAPGQGPSFDELSEGFQQANADEPAEAPAAEEKPAGAPQQRASADDGNDASAGAQSNWQEQGVGRNAYQDKMASLQGSRRGLLGGQDALNSPDILALLQHGGPAALRGLLG